MSWLLNVIPKPYLIGFAVFLLASTHITAYYKGYQSRDNKAKVELAKQAKAKLEAIAAYDLISRELVKAYQQKQVETKIVYRTIKEKVKDETTGSVCFNDSASRLWDSALQGVLPETTPRVAEKTTSTYTDEQILTNAIENFELYKDCREQLNALIDWHDNN